MVNANAMGTPISFIFLDNVCLHIQKKMVEMCLYEIHNTDKRKSIIICNKLNSHIKSYNLEITREGPKFLSSKRIKMEKWKIL